MIILDTNIIIYGATSQSIAEQFSIYPYAFSSIARIESLGYNKLTSPENSAINASLALGQQVQLKNITDWTRQRHNRCHCHRDRR